MTRKSSHDGCRGLVGTLALLAMAVQPSGLSAETLAGALSRAYNGNPTLNAQRASVRATDENVPRAKSGYRPRLNATADAGATYTRITTPNGGGGEGGGGGGDNTTEITTFPRGAGLQLDQTIFNGRRTSNSVRQAESQSLGARENLRNTEQNVIFDGATSYMNVLRDTAILSLQRNNVEVLDEQLRQTRDRFNVGEVTRTDVAQAEARQAGARSQVSLAEANLRTSIARFRQVIGVEPRELAPGQPVDRLVPRTIEASLALAQDQHPAIHAALHGVDAAELQVKITEGELLPTVGLRSTLAQRYDSQTRGDERFTASVVGSISIPIYEGGEVYARTRQSKETVGQRRIEADSIRDQVRAAVVSAWGQLESAKAQIIASQAQVQAAETALNGVREEARVGQRTTLDVLNSQQELLNARVNLITAQRDRVVASYAVVQATGQLSARALALRVQIYSAKQHFDQVKDLAAGARTPDGR